jgi:hypothetical protein
MSFVVSGCGPYSVSVREEHRFRVFKNKVLGTLFGTKMEEITRDLRILQFTKYYLDGKIKEDRMSRACSTQGEEERCLQGVVGKSE